MKNGNFLIVIDAQNDFISGALGNPNCSRVVENIVKKIGEYDTINDVDDMIFTFDTHDDNYLNTQEGKKLPVPHCIYGTKGWELDPRIKKTIAGKYLYMRIEKETFGYYNWYYELAGIIDEDTVFELVGFDTDICVVSNALLLKAAFPESRIVVDANCCWGTTKENHKAALAVMRSCQIEVVE